jgi:hypothetical protein
LTLFSSLSYIVRTFISSSAVKESYSRNVTSKNELDQPLAILSCTNCLTSDLVLNLTLIYYKQFEFDVMPASQEALVAVSIDSNLWIFLLLCY